MLNRLLILLLQLIYVLGLSFVFSGNQNLLAMIVSAVGVGLRIFLGTKIENKLAIGYVYVTINTQNKNQELIDKLRGNGFAITTYVGEGRDSDRYKYEILAKRNREEELFQLVESIEPKAFMIS